MTEKERWIEGQRLRREPIAGRHNKFVINEDGAWFLPFEEGEVVPTFAELLLAIFGEKLEDEGFVEDADARLEDGRLLLGYLRESGEVEIHSLLAAPSPAVRAKLREVLGSEVGRIGDDPADGGARPSAEGER